VRVFNDSDLHICTLDPTFVNKIEDEFDSRSVESVHEQLEIQDSGLRQLLSLLATESETGGPLGRLYADSLAYALTVRFLHVARRKKQQESALQHALPRHLLRRVIERMNSDLSTDLTLSALATESGYSRAHFLRMFRGATGKLPYQYLSDLRLDEAERRIRAGTTPLIEIAMACGFSSHSHLCKAFRRRFGVTPSEYRRNI
jgi:AraC family transcriptional regulator